MADPMHFCTYFDSRYLTRALALYDSLQAQGHEFTLWALTLDQTAAEVLRQLDRPEIHVVTIAELETADLELRQARENRSQVEFYWTCTAAWCHHLLSTRTEIELLTYIDADTWFFGDYAPLAAEVAEHSVAITPHDFSPHLAHMEEFGRYNVGWVSFRDDDTGRACLAEWRRQCIEWCEDRLDGARFADQKYLDAWPADYDDVHEIVDPGVNVAPWNLGKRTVAYDAERGLTAADRPLVFYHFHNLKRVRAWLYNASLDNYQEKLTPVLRRQVYGPYVRKLRELEEELRAIGAAHACGLNNLKLVDVQSRCPRPLRPAWWLLKMMLNRQCLTTW